MTGLTSKLADRFEELKDDFGRIGFWAVYALVMPIIGLTLLAAGIVQAGPWFKENPAGILVFIFERSMIFNAKISIKS